MDVRLQLQVMMSKLIWIVLPQVYIEFFKQAFPTINISKAQH